MKVRTRQSIYEDCDCDPQKLWVAVDDLKDIHYMIGKMSLNEMTKQCLGDKVMAQRISDQWDELKGKLKDL